MNTPAPAFTTWSFQGSISSPFPRIAPFTFLMLMAKTTALGWMWIASVSVNKPKMRRLLFLSELEGLEFGQTKPFPSLLNLQTSFPPSYTMKTYKTFIRSATNWEQFATARKTTVETGLSYEEAQDRCREYNENRNARQIRKGTKMEFMDAR